MGAKQSPPSAPDPGKAYQQGVVTNLKYLPKQLIAELGARQQYDPQYIALQQQLQQQYGPTQYAQELAALQQLDPTGTALRSTLGNQIGGMLRRGYINAQQAGAYGQLGQLASQAAAQGGWTPEQAQAYKALGQSVTSGVLRGTQADPTTLKEMSQAIRSRQGPYASGNAPAMAEAVYIGQRANQLQQQRQQASQGFLGLQNPQAQAFQGLAGFYGLGSPQSQALAQAGGFMGLPTPEQQIGQVQGVQAQTTNQYVNPYAGQQGQQFALQNYPNQAYAGQGSPNPWVGALAGAAGGAASGALLGSAVPGIGTAVGAVGGGLAGGLSGYFSSERLKRDIVKVGVRNGLDIIEFRYRVPCSALFRGVIAEQVQQLYPDAVGVRDGFLTVDYEQIGIPFEKKCLKCGEFKNINDFYPDRRRGIQRSDCKFCSVAAAHKWNTANLDRKKLVNQSRRKKQRQYEQERWHNDPAYKLLCRLRWFLRRGLKGQTKMSRARELLGCSIEDFKTHLETQFEPGMTWVNYGRGGWEIDHIMPCAIFDLMKLEHQKICFHFSNLQPMWGNENRAKWCNLTPEAAREGVAK